MSGVRAASPGQHCLVPLGPATGRAGLCLEPRGPGTVRVTAGAPPSLQSHRPLATVLPGRTHCQHWAKRPPEGSRTDDGSPLEPSPTQPPREPRPSMAAVDATVEKLRAQCLSRGASGIQGLARFFRRLDRDGSRALDAAELQRGLAKLGLALDTAEAEGVCRRWDRDGSGTLDLEEFLRALRPPMSQAREAVIAAAFAKLDRSGDGVVTVDDLRGVYNGRAHPKVRSGEWTEEEVLRRFLDNFDASEKDGQVTLAEFQDYYSGVSASVDRDEEFVAMMTSAWRL
nr:calcyphosin [Equus caballus]